MADKGEKENNRIYIIWIIGTIIFTIAVFCLFAAPTIYIDPLFHYHGPLANYEYPINNERYQNDGIIRNFDYDSIITGTSMTENFKTSEANELFNANFIKVPFSGGRYKEISDNIQRAYREGKEIKYIVRGLDYTMLIMDKDAYNEDDEYPTYLYNNSLFDDVNYVLNKVILCEQTRSVIKYTQTGNETTNFDEYVNWSSGYEYGAESVLAAYTLENRVDAPPKKLSREEHVMVVENIQQNITDLADEHPETMFYLFFPPYSICYWDALKNSGQVDWRIDAEQAAIEEIVKHPNIRLYSFCNNFELVCNLNNYKDQAHYGEWVNSWMLQWIHDGEYLLTEHNYQEYIREIREFYNSYDYSLLRE